MKKWEGPLEKIDEFRYRIPKSYHEKMRTDGIVFSNDTLVEQVKQDNALAQVANVAKMEGIVGHSLAMPDIHWGYGFPIGGVAAMDMEEGMISPGGVGYDINCGVRLVRTNLSRKDVEGKVGHLVDALFENVPSGLGSKGKVRVKMEEMDEILTAGSRWAVENNYGDKRDLEYQEENGSFKDADPGKVSKRAKERGMSQIGSLGAGNHFLEIQSVDEILQEDKAEALGITKKGQVVVMIHTGSRGAGHQIASDYIKIMERAVKKYGIDLPDRQLACAPNSSKEAQDYFGAMACGANYAWVNRQMITHWVRESFEKVLGMESDDMGMDLIYDIAHNIAKKEVHEVEGGKKELMVHRKGATRAFGPGRSEVPAKYRKIGQPVLIPGDMGTASYVLVGTDKAMEESFGSTCHGAGRVMSRKAATRSFNSHGIKKDLGKKGIYIKAASNKVLTEEAPGAYKDVSEVVKVASGSGISQLVAKMVPLGVMKG